MSKTFLFQTFLFQAIQISQTDLIQTIQFSISMQLVLFDSLIEPYQVLPLWVTVALGAMAIKGYSTFPKALALLEPHYQIILCHIQDNHWGSLTPCRDAVGVFYSISRLGQEKKELM